MELRRLGNSGLKVSAVGLGCNNFGMRIDEAETARVVHAAIDAGINFFDTADVYGGTQSEVMLGKALKGKRNDVIVATKFAMLPPGGGSRRTIMNTIEASLKRLDMDHVDLYQMHRFDPDTPLDETLRALDDCVRDGKVRYLGNSNYAGFQIADADWIARTEHLNRFVSAQNLYSLLERDVEKEVLPACGKFGLGFLPFFPLASGLLTGKYKKGEPPPNDSRLAAWGERGQRALNEKNMAKVEKLEGFAKERGHSLLELAFAWLLSRPAVSSVIAGATKPEQVQANAAAGVWRLTAEEAAQVDDLAK